MDRGNRGALLRMDVGRNTSPQNRVREAKVSKI